MGTQSPDPDGSASSNPSDVGVLIEEIRDLTHQIFDLASDLQHRLGDLEQRKAVQGILNRRD